MKHSGPNTKYVARSQREQIVSLAGFFALFPGFFFYHTLLGTGTIGAVLGGYFSPISMVLLIPLIISYYSRTRRQPNHLGSAQRHYGAFLLYFLVIVICNGAAGANPAIVVNQILCIMFMTNTFIIFSMIDFTSRFFRIGAIASLVAMTCIAAKYSVNGVFYLGAIGLSKDADSLATYQGFARSYLVTFLPVIAHTKNILFRIVLYVTAIATLFLNTARSEFVALLFIIPVIEFYFSRQKLLFLLAVVLIIVLTKLYTDQLMAAVPDNRILELLDLTHSTSANKRQHLSVHAIQTITAHPLMGDYASYSPGYYSHNILSAWVDLGLFGFVYLICILVLPALSMFLREYFARRNDGHFMLGFAAVSCTLLLLFTSHYFTDMLVGVTLGAFAQYRYWRRHGKYRTSDISASPSRYPDIHQAMPQLGSARS